MSKPSKIKILFILPSLSAGGAERVISFVSQNIDAEKFHPKLLVAGFEKDSVYEVTNVDVEYLNKPRIISALPSIVKQIRAFKPDIVVSSIAHVNQAMALLSPFFRRTKFIGREATVLGKRKNEKKSRKWSLAHLLPNGFEKLDAIICQSRDMADDMAENFNISREKLHVINNPISNLPKVKIKSEQSEPKKFITVGRLTEVKGHLRLLDILSKFKKPFTYTIIGDGQLKDKIFQRAEELGIINQIKHIPFTNKVNDYLAEHDVFLQGSYVEGFPNALLESCVVGTPVLAFEAPGGTKEIVENSVNGYMVKTEDEYLNTLKTDFNMNPEDVRESVYKKFNKEMIIHQYEALFQNILNN
ncbi:glycosyltransferase [Winogradskyella tangerina]|uniref:glycosyltransferase n=1 Tax=Winogradskyella tangerina TaxID=2023240 RepID=UPI000DBE2CF7|nr:glycosyltransferase [Winogradskyella tangerina]